MQENTRVMVFIDGSNLFHGLKNFNRENKSHFRVDINKLVDSLVNGRQLIRKIFYLTMPVDPKVEQIKFREFLRKSGFQVIEKSLKTKVEPNGEKRVFEKGLDVALVIDLLVYAYENAYDEAILVSGDADFVPAVERVLSKGKNVQIISFKNSFSSELTQKGMKNIFIDDLTNIFEEI